jgi:hypothetical protein
MFTRFGKPKSIAWDGECIKVQNVYGTSEKDLKFRVEKGDLMKTLHAIEEYHGLPILKIMIEPQADEDGIVTAWSPSWRTLTSSPPPNKN